jgi:hypothetical protein
MKPFAEYARQPSILRSGLSLRPKTMQYERDLPDLQWRLLDSLIRTPSRRKDGRGRPWKLNFGRFPQNTRNSAVHTSLPRVGFVWFDHAMFLSGSARNRVCAE